MSTIVVYGKDVDGERGHFDAAQFERVEELLSNKEVVCFDSEGVNLGRFGEISLFQFAVTHDDTPHVVLFDAYNMYDEYAALITRVLGDADVVKIVHDCRQDGDALFHHMGTSLNNVHDTMLAEQILNPGASRLGLNDVLEARGLEEVPHRGIDYKGNPAFWRESRNADKTLTDFMITYASGDVQMLRPLYERQSALLTADKKKKLDKEIDFALRMRDALVQDVSPRNMGKFIGRGGSNVRRLEKKYSVYIYGNRKVRGSLQVYYHNHDHMLAVKKEATY
jgi:exonuclease 3'-5' domain-containing protein 1